MNKPVVVIVVALKVYEPAVSNPEVFELYLLVVRFPVPVIESAGAFDMRLSVIPVIFQLASAIVVGVRQYRALDTVRSKSLNAMLPSQISVESS